MRGSVPKLSQRIGSLTNYVVDARESERPGLVRARAVIDYAFDVAEFGAEPGEKVSSYWGHNLPDGTLSEWQMQMTAAAALSVRGHDPVEHIVFSWRENEHPTDEQVEEAASLILNVLGYGNCPAIGAAHVNTKQKHGHLAVVRVDLITGRTAGSGWDIDRLHQATALIEERQGWATEPNALYVARGGNVFCRPSGVLVCDRAGNQVKRARRASGATPPNVTPHIANIEMVVMRSASWAELHEGLEAVGTEYVAKGSGATVRVGEEVHKASALHPDLSRPKLEKRLGPFEANCHRGSPEYVQYQAAGRAELARIRDHEAAAVAGLDAHLQAILETGLAFNNKAFRAAIRAAYASARAQLKVASVEAKARFKEQQLPYEEWKEAGQPQASFDIPLPALLFRTMPDVANASPSAAAGFLPQQHGPRCDYVDASGAVAFTDYGLVVIVHDKRPAAVDAALSLMAQGGGSVRVWGSDAFVQQCLERALVLGIDAIVDPSCVKAAKHTSAARSGPGATHAPGKFQVPDARPALNRPSTAPAPPAADVADQKPRGLQPTTKGIASRSTAETTSSQKEKDIVRRTNRQGRLALVARVIDELHEPNVGANTARAMAKSSPRLRNLSIGNLVRTGGQDTSMLLSRIGRSELVSKVVGDLGMRRAGHRLGLVEGEAGGPTAGLSPGQRAMRGSAFGLAAGATGTMADGPAIRSVAEKIPSATSPAPQDVGKENVRGNRSRAPVTKRDEGQPGFTPTSQDASAPGAFVESIWPGEAMPQVPTATEPRTTTRADDDLHDRQLLQKLIDRGKGR